jgi:L-lactate dehydrogenase complex protein LldG
LDPGEPWEPFQKEVEALSGRFHRAEGIREAQAVIRAILTEHGVRSAIRWEHPLLEALEIDDILGEAGVELVSAAAEEDFTQRCAQAELGITAAEALLVESGSVIVVSRVSQVRSVSLIPPVHLAVITPGQRMSSVSELPPLMRQWGNEAGLLPSAIHLITGPSRTADIELNLVLGVHGPKVLHLLAVDPARLPAKS